MTVAVLCGEEGEADLLQQPGGPIDGLAVFCNNDGAAKLTKSLCDGARYDGLLAFGTCGGLVDIVPVGTVFVATKVMTERGGWIDCDRTWRQALWSAALDLYRKRGVTIRGGYTYSSSQAVTTPRARQELFHRTGCYVSEMESNILAPFAAQYRLPFASLRFVSDGWDDTLPLEAADLSVVNSDGSPNIRRLVTDMLTDPHGDEALAAMAVKYNKALDAGLSFVQMAAGALQRVW